MFGRIHIRTDILGSFLIVMGLVVGALLGLQYYFSRQMALEATRQTFRQTAAKITLHIRAGDQRVRDLLHAMALYPGLDDAVGRDLPMATVARLAHNLVSDDIYAIYTGYADGNFFEVVNMHSAPDLARVFDAPPATRWTVIRVMTTDGVRIRRFDFLDDDFEVLAARREPSRYRADRRPWYTQALKAGGTTRSDPYLFSNLGRTGITFSRPIAGGRAVLAVDFTLSNINAMLRRQLFAPTSEVYLFGRAGAVIASSLAGGRRPAPALVDGLKRAETDHMLSLEEGGRTVFAMVTDLSRELGAKTRLGFSVDAEVMLRPYLEKILYALGMALLVLVPGVALTLYATSRIIAPVRALMAENDKIRRRCFDEVRLVKTNIIELSELSDSLVSMAESIYAYQRAQKELMDSFFKLIADAIDTKSPYTGGHCKRVPVIAMMLARAVGDSRRAGFESFRLESEEDWHEFEMGAWLHDCGKITTPEYVVDKATRLETIYNRIHEIRTRFEVLWRDIEIAACRRLLDGEDRSAVQNWKVREQRKLTEDFAFVACCNLGGERMTGEKRRRIRAIAGRTWLRHFDDRLGLSQVELQRRSGEESPLPAVEPLLADRPEHLVARVGFDAEGYRREGFRLEVPRYLYNHGEIYNLCIERGTLTAEERFKINEHVIMSIRMLERLPYPEDMARIPEYAGTHHENVDGSGYPRGLSRENLSVAARIMAIADIFEALTASDRPYKKGKTLSEAVAVMRNMQAEGHIDGRLLRLFLDADIPRRYAEQYLDPRQIDDIEPAADPEGR